MLTDLPILPFHITTAALASTLAFGPPTGDVAADDVPDEGAPDAPAETERAPNPAPTAPEGATPDAPTRDTRPQVQLGPLEAPATPTKRDIREVPPELVAPAVRLADHYGTSARRERIWRGALGGGFGLAQVSLGIYGLAEPSFSPPVHRTAVAQIVLGSIGTGFGIYRVVRRSPMERLVDEPAFRRLRAHPGDEAALEEVTAIWHDHAIAGRKVRQILGSGYLVAGLGVAGLGTAMLTPQLPTDSPAEKLWAYTTLATGVSLVLKGSTDLAVRSPIERAYAAHAAALGLDVHPSNRERRRDARQARKRRRRQSVQVSATLGGISVRGDF